MAYSSMPCLAANSDQAVRLMFEARKRVFVDLLKWNVPVCEDKYEIDQFDTQGTDYLLLEDQYNGHRGSARLLRTDRAHILSELFAYLCDGDLPCGETTREITRFCIEPGLCRADRRMVRNQLVTALVMHAMATGITDYTAVANLAWYRQIIAFGWKCRSLGPSRDVEGASLIAFHIEINARTLQDIAGTGTYSASTFRLIEAGLLQ